MNTEKPYSLKHILKLTFAVVIPLVFLVGVAYFVSIGKADIYIPKIAKSLDKLIAQKSTKTSSEEASEAAQPSPFESILKPIFSKAVQLQIDSLGINIPLISVNLAPDKSLETPKDWQIGGWYEKSARPGEKGNVIINAHYDDNYGRPAAFWQLKNIKAGDKVSVQDSFGNAYTYQVDEVFYVDMNDPNRLDVLKKSLGDRSTVTLITCGGIWLTNGQSYSKRLVVRGNLL